MKHELWIALLAMIFCLATSTTSIAADDGHGLAGHQHIAVAIGIGKEETPDEQKNASAIGLEYEYRLSDAWGIGAVLEYLDVEYRGNVVTVIPVSYHVGDFRVFAGPGYEFKENERKDKGLIRVGIGYEIHLDEHWSLAPEAFVDMLEGDGDTWLIGVALGYGF